MARGASSGNELGVNSVGQQEVHLPLAPQVRSEGRPGVAPKRAPRARLRTSVGITGAGFREDPPPMNRRGGLTDKLGNIEPNTSLRMAFRMTVDPDSAQDRHSIV